VHGDNRKLRGTWRRKKDNKNGKIDDGMVKIKRRGKRKQFYFTENNPTSFLLFFFFFRNKKSEAARLKISHKMQVKSYKWE
jgi:hypothetical protein